MKRILSLLAVFALTLTLFACSKTDAKKEGKIVTDVPAELAQIAKDAKVYVVAPGLGELSIVQTLFTDESFTVDKDTQLIQAKDIDTSNKTVIFMALGCTGKGLGDAGTDEAKEKTRGEEIGKLGENANVTVVGLITNAASRGEKSDPIHTAVAKYCDLLIVKTSTDEDGFISNISGTYDIPLLKFSKSSELSTYINKVLGK